MLLELDLDEPLVLLPLPLLLVPEELLPDVPLRELDGDRFLLLSFPSEGLRLGGDADLASALRLVL